MSTHQAANGVATPSLPRHHRQSARYITNNIHAPPPLLRLPTDVWLYIFAHLPAQTLSALSRTCKHILRLVDEHGWKHVLASDYASVQLDRLDAPHNAYTRQARAAIARSKWWFACRYAALLTHCWSDVTLRAGSVDIATAHRKMPGRTAGRARRFGGGDFAIPTLTTGTRWIIVGARSELAIYRVAEPRTLVARIRLNSRLGDSAAAAAVAQDDPWLDVTALQAVDAEASTVVVGYADGCVQLLGLRSNEKGKSVAVDVLRHYPAVRRQEVASVSVQKGSASSSNDVGNEGLLIASVSKRGCLRIHRVDPDSHDEAQEWSWQLDSSGVAAPTDLSTAADDSGAATPRTLRSVAFNNAPVLLDSSAAGSATRAWSVLLGSCTDTRDPAERKRWVAVGLTAEHAVYIYPLSLTSAVELDEPFYVASTGQRTSVYAMATPPVVSTLPAFLLFVGFYDGVVRVYDTRQLSLRKDASANGGRRARRELDPIAVFRENYDTDAVYSISFGGPRGEALVIGGARHAKVRVFDVSCLAGYSVPLLSAPGAGAGAGEARDWTAFALRSTDSPLYGVVAHADRVVGVTDRKLWWFDFGAAILDDEKERGDEKVAYFRHADGELCYSTPHHHTRDTR